MSRLAGTGELALALLREARRELSDLANTASIFRSVMLRGAAPLAFKQTLAPTIPGDQDAGRAILAGS